MFTLLWIFRAIILKYLSLFQTYGLHRIQCFHILLIFKDIGLPFRLFFLHILLLLVHLTRLDI